MAGCPHHVPVYPGAAVCQVGTGSDSFTPIHPGDRVAISRGIQGGSHIWASVRARWVSGSGATQAYTLSLADGTVLSTQDQTTDLAAVAPSTQAGETGWEESLGSRAFVSDPGALDGKSVKLHVDLTDEDGRACSDEQTFVAYLP